MQIIEYHNWSQQTPKSKRNLIIITQLTSCTVLPEGEIDKTISLSFPQLIFVFKTMKMVIVTTQIICYKKYIGPINNIFLQQNIKNM